MTKVSGTHSPSVRIHLGNWGMLGWWCLQDKVDTTISCTCTYTVGSAQCFECVVYWPIAIAAT